MTQSHRRHDISDKIWALLEEHLPDREGAWGGVATDNRQFINAVILDYTNRSPMEGFTAGLRGLEQYPPPLYSLA